MTTALETLRGTGRTTRMLHHALDLADEGRAVYVIADNKGQAAYFKEQLRSHPSISVENGAPSNFDWDTRRLQGAHSNCVVLVDHYVIERKYAGLLEMLHRYDDPRKEGGTK